MLYMNYNNILYIQNRRYHYFKQSFSFQLRYKKANAKHKVLPTNN